MRKLQTNSTSGHNGVTWAKKDKRWRAHIKVDGVKFSLGSYRELEDAVAARAEADLDLRFEGEDAERSFDKINEHLTEDEIEWRPF